MKNVTEEQIIGARIFADMDDECFKLYKEQNKTKEKQEYYLNISLEIMIEIEDYERCSKIKNLLKRL